MQLAATLTCKTNEERHNLVKYMFHNQNRFGNFSNTYRPFLASMLQAHNALIIGDFDSDKFSENDDGEYMYAQMVEPGKHSVYLYFPSLDKFYSTIIAVEATEPGFERKGETVEDPHSFKFKVSHEENEWIELFLDDINKGQIAMKPLFETLTQEQINEYMETLWNNYRKLCVVFQELQSESQTTYPFLDNHQVTKFGLFRESEKLVEMMKNKLTEGDQGNTLSYTENMDRSLFLRFILWGYLKHQDQWDSFDQFIKQKILSILEFNGDVVRDSYKDHPEIVQYLNENAETVYKYIDTQLPKINYSNLVQLTKILPISSFNIQKFFILSKEIKSSNFNNKIQTGDEFLQFIKLNALYIYNENNYKE